MEVNRTYGIALLADVLIDECVITRDVAGPFDATLNETTGLLEGGDTLTLYDGPCLIKSVETRDTQIIDGGMPKYANNYRLRIPFDDGADVRLGDTVTVTAAINDPALLDKVFKVFSFDVSTHSIYRGMWLQVLEDQLGSIRGSD